MQPNRENRLHYGWLVLATGTLGVFGALGLARFGYTMLLPSMQIGLGMDNSQAGLLATVNLTGYLLMSILGGALASKYGARRVASLGLLLAGIAMLSTGNAANIWEAAFWRGLTGIGSGAANVAIMGLWAAWFTREKRGLASGIAVSGSSLGLISAGLFIPYMLNLYHGTAWRYSWYVFGALALLLALASVLILRNIPAAKGLQPVGAVTASAAPPSPAAKLEWKRVYASPAVWQLGLVYVAFGFSYIIYMTFFTKHLLNSGYTPAGAGRLFMLMGWTSIVCGLVWGMVSDRIGRKQTLIILYLIQAGAFALFAVSTPAAFIFSLLLFGITAWSIPAVMAATCGDLLGAELAPAALGFITLFFGIGQAAGPWVAGGIADAAKSFAPTFILAAGVALLGAVGAGMLKAASKHSL